MKEYVKGIPEVRIEMMNSLRIKYPFLEDIIKDLPHDLFSIQVRNADKSVMEEQCQAHVSQGPEAFDQQFYYLLNCELHEMHHKDPSPTVKEDLRERKITPDALIKIRHQKYGVNGEHRRDVELTVYL